MSKGGETMTSKQMLAMREADVAEPHVTHQVVERPPWSPAQVLAVATGIVLIVISGVALARGGVNPSNAEITYTQVAGMGFTSMSAIIQLVAGVLILAGGVHPVAAKATMWFFSVALLSFGLIVAIDSTPFHRMWGYGEGNGVFYTVIGAALLVVAATAPVIVTRRRGLHAGQAGETIPHMHVPKW